MPLEAKPLFRPDVLRTHLGAFPLPERVETVAPKLGHWAELLSSRRADSFKEQELLPDFLTDFFCGLLGYTRPADGQPRYTISREKHVEVDGKFADAVLGDFNGEARYLVALEGKGPRDPLDRPFAGRRMSAVDQAYRYAINLPCDWIVVTSVRETRLRYGRQAVPATQPRAPISTPTSVSTPRSWPTTRRTSSGSCSCWGPSGWCRRPGDAISIRSGKNR